MNSPNLKTIEDILKEHWRFSGELQRLAGFEDYNYKLTAGQVNYLVKVSEGAYNQDLDLQIKALKFASAKGGSSPLQLSFVHTTLRGENYVSFHQDGRDFCMRVYSWLPGITFAAYQPKSNEILEDLGYKAGLHLNLLSGFTHPAEKEKISNGTLPMHFG